jgi:hypothetical protein
MRATDRYQRHITAEDYGVVVLDKKSTPPFDSETGIAMTRSIA